MERRDQTLPQCRGYYTTLEMPKILPANVYNLFLKFSIFFWTENKLLP